MRRRLLVALSVALAAGALVVGTSAVTAGASTASKKLTKCAPKSAAKGITNALNAFLTGDTGEDKLALTDLTADELAAMAPAIDESSRIAEEGGLSLPVEAGNVTATCDSKKAATFGYDLQNSETGDPLLPDQSGNAVLKKGKWFLDPAFPCDLSANNPAAATAVAACYTAIGLDVPVA